MVYAIYKVFSLYCSSFLWSSKHKNGSLSLSRSLLQNLKDTFSVLANQENKWWKNRLWSGTWRRSEAWLKDNIKIASFEAKEEGNKSRRLTYACQNSDERKMDVVHPSSKMRAEKKIQNFLVPFLDGLRHTRTGKMVLDSRLTTQRTAAENDWRRLARRHLTFTAAYAADGINSDSRGDSSVLTDFRSAKCQAQEFSSILRKNGFPCTLIDTDNYLRHSNLNLADIQKVFWWESVFVHF